MAGEGFQMAAIQAREYCRNLLKKRSLFQGDRENKFINPPKWNIEIPTNFYNDLKIIKEERMKKESKIKRIIYTGISAMVGFIIICFLYLMEKH